MRMCENVPRKPPIMMNVHKVRVRIFWRFLSGLSVCEVVIAASGGGANFGAGTTVIPGCFTGSVGLVTERRSSSNLRPLGSGIDDTAAGPGSGSGSRVGSGTGGSEWCR